jgi:hypothetical protein
MKKLLVITALLALVAGSGCTLKVVSPEPITINMNIKIDHEVRIKVDKELDQLIDDDSTLF